MKNHVFRVYNPNRLEWHLGERLESLNPIVFCAVLSDDKRTFDSSQSFVVALAKSQDRRVNYGVFAFGQPNAVRRWFVLRYSATRASQSRKGGRIARAWWLIKSGIVRCDDMAPKRKLSSTERLLYFDTVRLCFAQTFTKEELNT